MVNCITHPETRALKPHCLTHHDDRRSHIATCEGRTLRFTLTGRVKAEPPDCRKRAHLPKRWCRSCHSPPPRSSISAPPSCQHMETSTASKLRKIQLHSPKHTPAYCHPSPRLATKDRLNAQLRLNTDLWAMIDSRRVEGGSKWDLERISRIGKAPSEGLNQALRSRPPGGGAPAGMC